MNGNTSLTVESISASMFTSLEGYVSYVVDSLEFELKRELTSEEQQFVFRHVESIVDGTALATRDKRIAEVEAEILAERSRAAKAEQYADNALDALAAVRDSGEILDETVMEMLELGLDNKPQSDMVVEGVLL